MFVGRALGTLECPPSYQQSRQPADGVLSFGDHPLHDRRCGQDLADESHALPGIVGHELGVTHGFDRRRRARERRHLDGLAVEVVTCDRPGWRRAAFGERASEQPMRSARGPGDAGDVAIDGVRRARLQQPLLVFRVRGRFRTGNETGTDPYAVGTEGKGRCQTAAVYDAARREHGCGCHGFDDGGQQWQEAHLPRTCPPASIPWATITSTPASAAFRASSAEPT
jgi:hypothetical protein